MPVILTPTVTGVSPNSGPPSGGTSVTISGANLTSVNWVKFGSVSASFTNTGSLIAVAPAGSAGTVDITVNTTVGTTATSSADQFTYVFPFAGQSLASPPGPQQFQRTLVLTTGPPIGWGPQASARGRQHG